MLTFSRDSFVDSFFHKESRIPPFLFKLKKHWSFIKQPNFIQCFSEIKKKLLKTTTFNNYRVICRTELNTYKKYFFSTWVPQILQGSPYQDWVFYSLVKTHKEMNLFQRYVWIWFSKSFYPIKYSLLSIISWLDWIFLIYSFLHMYYSQNSLI